MRLWLPAPWCENTPRFMSTLHMPTSTHLACLEEASRLMCFHTVCTEWPRCQGDQRRPWNREEKKALKGPGGCASGQSTIWCYTRASWGRCVSPLAINKKNAALLRIKYLPCYISGCTTSYVIANSITAFLVNVGLFQALSRRTR